MEQQVSSQSFFENNSVPLPFVNLSLNYVHPGVWEYSQLSHETTLCGRLQKVVVYGKNQDHKQIKLINITT